MKILGGSVLAIILLVPLCLLSLVVFGDGVYSVYFVYPLVTTNILAILAFVWKRTRGFFISYLVTNLIAYGLLISWWFYSWEHASWYT